ncbi:MAG: hydroxymethylbilane synthase [Geminicoccaceae bacterium]
MTLRLPLRLGTRGSPLALAQAHMVKAALATAHPSLADDAAVEIQVVSTQGDRIQDRTLAEIGGKGLFTEEIEAGLLDGRLDLAVHSMKDMPTALPTGLVISAVLERADPRDALIARGQRGIADLAQGAVVGTASLRRAAQLRAVRPDLEVVPLRGNVQTRLRKLAAGEVHATFLAMAGLIRLGLEDVVSAPLAPEEMLPAVAQGAIGIESRADDELVLGLLAAINHGPTMLRITTERAFLAVLDGSCRTPIAALAEIDGVQLRLRGLVASPDGLAVERIEMAGGVDDCLTLGASAGSEIRARLAPGFFAT